MKQKRLDFSEYRAICELKARYFRAVDTHDWALLDEVFTPETQFRGYGSGVRSGVDELREMLSANFAQVQSRHQGVNPEMSEFRWNDAGEVVAVRTRWSFSDELHWPVEFTALQMAEVDTHVGLTGTGYYEDEVWRTPAGWRITMSRHYRTRLVALTETWPVVISVPHRPLDPDWV